MKNSQLLKILEDLGLTENESQVYLTALSLGPTTVLAIARAAEIRRTTVYAVIDSLKTKGLMHIESRGFKQVYVAESPEQLVSILEHKKHDLEQHIPEFMSLYNLKGTESTIQYYEGIESIKRLYDEVLEPLRPHEDFLVISDIQNFFSADKFFNDYLDRRIKSRVNARLLLTDSDEARRLKKYSKQMNHEVRILPKEYKLSIDTMITKHQVSIFNLEQPITAINIKNPTTIKAQMELFEIMWNSLPE
jgi:sugar-specific transcriptional regulator TrmB